MSRTQSAEWTEFSDWVSPAHLKLKFNGDAALHCDVPAGASAQGTPPKVHTLGELCVVEHGVGMNGHQQVLALQQECQRP